MLGKDPVKVSLTEDRHAVGAFDEGLEGDSRPGVSRQAGPLTGYRVSNMGSTSGSWVA